MGSSSSSIELAGKLTNFGTTGIPQAMRAGVAKAALAGKVELTAAGVAAGLPASGKLRNMRGRWGVRYTIFGKANPTALLRMYGAGPYIFNEGAKPHPIVPRKAGKARKGIKATAALTGSLPTITSGMTGSARVLKLPNGYRRFVNHPGMAGRHFWRPAAARVERTASRVVATQTTIEMAKAWK